MMAKMQLGLRFRLAFGASLLVLAVSLAGAVLFAGVARRELTSEFQANMTRVAANLSSNAAYGVFVGHGEDLKDLVANLLTWPDVQRVVIVNAKGETIADQPPHVRDTSTGVAESPVFYSPDTFAGEKPPPKIIGKVSVYYSTTNLESEISRVRTSIGLASLATAIVGMMIAIWIAGRIVGPLKTLSDATAAVAAGNFETKVGEAGGDEIGALARSFNRMIDALKTSRARLEESYAELARKDRLATLGQFTAVIAHELRNPLGVILSSAQVISNPKRTPEMKEKAAAFIVEEVRRLNADLTSFLNFARPKPPELKAASLADIAKRAIDAWRGSPGVSERTPNSSDAHPDAAATGVTVRVKDEGAPLAAADPDQVHQLLLNLLFNSAQALSTNSAHGGNGNIVVSAATVEGRPALVVEDDGPGIPEDVRARIFEPFFTTRKRGSGLGLAVVDQIARSHGGEVRLWTEPGRGTRFTILFNVAPSGSGAATSPRSLSK